MSAVPTPVPRWAVKGLLGPAFDGQQNRPGQGSSNGTKKLPTLAAFNCHSCPSDTRRSADLIRRHGRLRTPGHRGCFSRAGRKSTIFQDTERRRVHSPSENDICARNSGPGCLAFPASQVTLQPYAAQRPLFSASVAVARRSGEVLATACRRRSGGRSGGQPPREDVARQQRTTMERRLTHSFPFPIYRPQGGLRQAPGRAA
ncbi:hypothetical protein ACVWZ8_002716 [Arthrobacter sp. UYCu723]